ncbi:MAG: formyltetrahydrofolate deformylase [Planctomycetes bacterium]|nr:formyltetrahydrofolate deformylase [Planctomycetota bacterium]
MRSSLHATLLVSCADGPGIVAALARFVFEQGGNILDSDQHADSRLGVFFTRLTFTLDGFLLARDLIAPSVEALLSPHEPTVEVRFSDETKRGAILVSKTNHCLYDLLLRQEAGELCCEFPLVIANHDTLRGVAEHFGRAFHHVPITKETKAAQEGVIFELLERERIDFVVLARYMQVLTPAFVDRYPNRVINIHHGFLPAFQGAKPYHQAHKRGVKLIGASGHYVTADLDEGPIIAQSVVPVSHSDSIRDMVHKGRDLEKSVLANAVRCHVEDRILVYANKTVVFD